MKIILKNNNGFDEVVKTANEFLKRSKDTKEYNTEINEDKSINGYKLEKNDSEIKISYSSVPELCRALLHSGTVDKGSFAVKKETEQLGYMADASRNAVPRVSTLKELIKLLAFSGYDYLGLYIEDTIEVKEEKYLGYMRGRYSTAEIEEVRAYAEKFGMELRPYVQSLAHFNQITRYACYDEIIDINDILLAGEEKTYKFLDNYLSTVIEAFKPEKINIGMDEAFQLGHGKYLFKHGVRDRKQIMLEHLDRVLEICGKYDVKVQLWSDMFYHLIGNNKGYTDAESDLSSKINVPKNVELVYWDYYSTDTDHYDKIMQQHKSLGCDVGFAGGAWKWEGLVAHNRYSMQTGKAAMKAAKKNEMKDIVITGWGDNGSEASQFSNFPALYFDANLLYDKELDNEAFRLLTDHDFEEIMLLDKLNYPTKDPNHHNNSSKYFFFDDVLIGTFLPLMTDEVEKYYVNLEKEYETAFNNRDNQFDLMIETHKALSKALSRKIALERSLRKLYSEGTYDKLFEKRSDIDELIKVIENLYDCLQKQFETENKSLGFEVQTIRFGGMIKRLQDVSDKILRLHNKEISVIEELEEELLPFAYFNEDLETLNYNHWSVIASPNIMG